MINTQSSISIGFINSTVMQAYVGREQALRKSISDLQAKGGDVSNLDMISLQQSVQEWSLASQVLSTLAKEISDAMKGVIQKAA